MSFDLVFAYGDIILGIEKYQSKTTMKCYGEVQQAFEINRNTSTLFYAYAYITEEDNKVWVRLFDWSAYLYAHLPDSVGIKLEKTIKINHKQYDELPDSVIYVGWPKTSMAKFCGDIKPMESADNVIVFDLTKFFVDSNINLNNYTEKLTEWKKDYEIKIIPNKSKGKFTKSKNVDFSDIPYVNSDYNINNDTVDTVSMKRILKKIYDYPIFDRTLNEQTRFLQEIQGLIRDIVKF